MLGSWREQLTLSSQDVVLRNHDPSHILTQYPRSLAQNHLQAVTSVAIELLTGSPQLMALVLRHPHILTRH